MSKGQSTQGGETRTPDEIERKIYGGEYARDVTLRQLYGDLSLDEIKRIPKFKRDNHALFGLLVTAEVVTHKEGRGLIHQAMVDNYLRDFPIVRFYDGYRIKSPAAPTNENAAILAAILANTEAAVRNTKAIRTDLDGWREYVKNLLDAGGANHADNEPTKKKRGKNLATLKPDLGLANIKSAIVKIWDDFNKGEADCEMPNGRLRQSRQSRSFAECIERYGQTVIRGNLTLLDLLTVPESGKKPEVVFEAIVHSADESKRQRAVKIRTKDKHSAKPPQKKKPK